MLMIPWESDLRKSALAMSNKNLKLQPDFSSQRLAHIDKFVSVFGCNFNFNCLERSWTKWQKGEENCITRIFVNCTLREVKLN
jgi:hypothetical protein